LLYYFEVHQETMSGLSPGFTADLSNRPYWLVSSRRAADVEQLTGAFGIPSTPRR
jgi:hypothetical protein